MLREKKPGASPRLRGTSVSPGSGVGFSRPQGVSTTPGSVGSSAYEGRSVKTVSPFTSRPIVMLYGPPVEPMMNGLRRTSPGSVTLPISMKRWRTSFEPRPQSAPGSSELAGKLPEPSVLLRAQPRK